MDLTNASAIVTSGAGARQSERAAATRARTRGVANLHLAMLTGPGHRGSGPSPSCPYSPNVGKGVFTEARIARSNTGTVLDNRTGGRII